jgi:hypothetical protein
VLVGAAVERIIRHLGVVMSAATEVIFASLSQALGRLYLAWETLERRIADYLWSLFLLDRIRWPTGTGHREYYESYTYEYYSMAMYTTPPSPSPALIPSHWFEYFFTMGVAVISFVMGHFLRGGVGGADLL